MLEKRTINGYEIGQYDAIMIAEGVEEPESEEHEIACWQYIYSTGLYQHLQGFFGRTVDALLRADLIH